jgi:spermidine synthase
MQKSRILKIALFATGLSGIVAEYTLSTLATYFLGDSVFQWTITLSLMLFAMGLGSRLSRSINRNILESFIIIEFLLSILTSVSALITYGLLGYTLYTGAIIYSFSIAIGLLIGMEIPLVTRINEENEDLRTNIAGVMENDYYGSLVGGLFFAFIGLPYLGLTYTPFILGAINFIVAVALFIKLRKYISSKKYYNWLSVGAVFVFIIISLGLYMAKPIIVFGEQSRYSDKVILSKQTKYQKITVTQWKDNYWLYLNTSKQLCTFDEWLYHEPLVHPVMQLSKKPKSVLILGAGDGCAIRECLKYTDVERIVLVDLDKEMTDLGANHPIFTNLNDSAYHNDEVEVLNIDAFNYLENSNDFFDVIIADFPDPRSIELNRLYTKEFYQLCHKKLRHNGFIITQAASPYYTTKAFNCIDKTLTSAGFNTIPIHNHVYTFGEWGWIIGAKNQRKESLKPALQSLQFNEIEKRWINNEAMLLMTSFGNDLVLSDSIEVNSIHNPVLYKYYNTGIKDAVY